MITTRNLSREVELEQHTEQQQRVEQQKREEANHPPEQRPKHTPIENNTAPDPHSELKLIGGAEFQPSVSYDDVIQEDIKLIAEMPWFRHQAVFADALNGFSGL